MHAKEPCIGTTLQPKGDSKMGMGSFMVGFLPLLVWFAVAVYVLVLATRLVNAVEKIADKLDSR